MEAHKINITGIFNQGRELHIPFFQRGYVWQEPDWQRFLDSVEDTSESKKPHFFGSLILKNIPTSISQDISDRRAVIDGQQRLTTFCLLFKALCNVQDVNEKFKAVFFNLKSEVILKHNQMDREIFDAIMQDNISPELEKKYRNNNVLNAYKFFMDNKKTLQTIDVLTVLTNAQFVGIELTENEDEQQIFDTINSLGVRLTTAELLKNHLYPSNEYKDLYNSTWFNYFEKDEDTRNFWDADITSGREKRNNLDVLLQSFFIISKKNSSKFKLNNLFQEYKSYLDENGISRNKDKLTSFVSELMNYADLYKKHIDYTLLEADSDIEIKTPLQRLIVAIFSLDITTLVPYVLYVLKEVKDEAEQDAIFKFLETYVIRCFICKVTTKNYNNLFASLINNEIKTVDGLRSVLVDTTSDSRMPSDSEVRESFTRTRKAHYIPKTILYLLELAIRNTGRQNTKLLSIKNYDLEHILPQKWRANWPLPQTELSPEEQEDLRNRKVASIGNMTILKNGLNKSLHNESWQKKKSGKKDDGLVKYGAGLETFSQYIDLPEWNEETIDNRADFLLEKALEIWKI